MPLSPPGTPATPGTPLYATRWRRRFRRAVHWLVHQSQLAAQPGSSVNTLNPPLSAAEVIILGIVGQQQLFTGDGYVPSVPAVGGKPITPP
jgi:hypothetical protein